MRPVTLAATQFACSWDLPANADAAERVIRAAAARGAHVVLVQELFATPYFCITQRAEYLALAAPAEGHPLIARFAALARELGVVLPVSFFERAGTAFFNSVAMVDADGRILGLYRKSHIPQGPGYEEKYYFFLHQVYRLDSKRCMATDRQKFARDLRVLGVSMIVEKLDGPRVSGEQFPRPCYLATVPPGDFCVSARAGERSIVSIGTRFSDQPWLAIDLGAAGSAEAKERMELLILSLLQIQNGVRTGSGQPAPSDAAPER